MNDALRNELYRQRREHDEMIHAEGRTLADIEAQSVPAMDRDDMKPLREIVADMLGLKINCRYTNHGWASQYGPRVKDVAARNLLDLLVKRTNLLANELKTGAADLKWGDKVRVDKVLDIAAARGWWQPIGASTSEARTEATPQHKASMPGPVGRAVKVGGGQRRHVMDPWIEKAETASSSRDDKQQVFSNLQKMAAKNEGPMLGFDESGVKYMGNKGEVKWYSPKNLSDRNDRRRNKLSGAR